MHFILTSVSWLNVIDRSFRSFTPERIRNGIFRSKAELTAVINDYVRHHNENAITFVSIESAEQILEDASRAKATLMIR